MFIKKRLMQAFCLSLWLLGSYSYAQGISLSLNKSVVATGDFLEGSVVVNDEKINATQADVYLAVQVPDGSLYYLHGFGLEFLNRKNRIVPLITGWTIQSLSKTTLFKFKVPNKLPSGTYKWYLTLAKTGSDVAQPANWIANVSAAFVLKRGEEDRFVLDGMAPSESYDGALEKSEGATTASGGTGSGAATAPTSKPKPTAPVSAEPAPAPPMVAKTADDVVAADFIEEGEADSGSSCCDDDFDDDLLIEPMPPILSPPFPDEDVIPVSGTLTAGDIDDNLNFAAFQRYLNTQRKMSVLPFVDLSDRVTLHIVDDNGKGVSNALVRISNQIDAVPRVDTYAGADGRFYLFPKFDGLNASSLELQLAPPEEELGSPNSVFSTILDLNQLDKDRRVTVTMPNTVATLPYSLDMMFVIDTTGSMGDELRYLVTELRDIISTVQARHQQIRMRFGLVVYRDQGDAYVVRNLDFTDSLNDMQIQLSEQQARGGGDYPEAMEQALATALKAKWREGNIARLVFLVADAPPHDKNLEAMLDQVRIARQMGLRIYPLAASGVGDKAEFMMRQAGVLTQGRYLFLTDDSGVGFSHQEPSVSCYVVTQLDKLLSRVISGELAGKRVEPSKNDIIRAVGNYQAGICEAGNVKPPEPSEKTAQVESIDIQILESFPVRVRVVAQGYFRNGCEKIEQVTSVRKGNTFTVKIITISEEEFCTDVIVPFEETIKLDVDGLKAGTYTVDVNGVTDTFKLEVDNELVTKKAQVENIRIQIMESFPVQVHVIANGYLADSCEKIERVGTVRHDNAFTVTINTHSVGDRCEEAEQPFEKVIPLEVNGLKAGTYTVHVNGVTDRFTLDSDNVAKPIIPDWLTTLIDELSTEPVANPPAQISQYTYNGATVYYLPAKCCDIMSDLYDVNGKVLCNPDGGLTGAGDGQCTDFHDTRKDKVIIWQDNRKREL